MQATASYAKTAPSYVRYSTAMGDRMSLLMNRCRRTQASAYRCAGIDASCRSCITTTCPRTA